MEAQVQLEQVSHPVRVETQRYLNRELSQIDFAHRVLALADDQSLPLLERVRFLAILGENLDQFFQVRVAGLKEQQLLAAHPPVSPDGLTPTEQLRAIRDGVEMVATKAATLINHEIVPGLKSAGIRLVRTEELDDDDRGYIAGVFRDRIFPVLTPLAVDPAHPFPYISNLSLNLAVMVKDTLRRQLRFARVKVPPLLPRFVPLPDGQRFVTLEQVIALQLQGHGDRQPSRFPGHSGRRPRARRRGSG